MRKAVKEYSLAELLEHPALGWVMARGAIDRRCLDLILDAPPRDRRYAEIETRTTISDHHTPNKRQGLTGRRRR
jgi:hypothetical protein